MTSRAKGHTNQNGAKVLAADINIYRKRFYSKRASPLTMVTTSINNMKTYTSPHLYEVLNIFSYMDY